MKTGTHNLGKNAFASPTFVKVSGGSVIIQQVSPAGDVRIINLSAEQAQLLKDVLA